MITQADLDHWFRYHSPADISSEEERQRTITAYTEIRQAGKALAETIVRHCPPSADASAAVRKVREATMTANAAIACGGVATASTHATDVSTKADSGDTTVVS